MKQYQTDVVGKNQGRPFSNSELKTMKMILLVTNYPLEGSICKNKQKSRLKITTSKISIRSKYVTAYHSNERSCSNLINVSLPIQ